MTVGVETTCGRDRRWPRPTSDPQGIVLVQAEEWTAVAVGESIQKGERVSRLWAATA